MYGVVWDDFGICLTGSVPDHVLVADSHNRLLRENRTLCKLTSFRQCTGFGDSQPSLHGWLKQLLRS